MDLLIYDRVYFIRGEILFDLFHSIIPPVTIPIFYSYFFYQE